MSSTAEPGWYDDGSGKQRWWDGSRWTEHYVDLGAPDLQLRADDTAPARTPTSPGWYDDGRGRRRWWDGRQWTTAVQPSGAEEQFGGIVADGRWIHFGPLSEPVGRVAASVTTADKLSKTPALGKAVKTRTLFGPQGRMSASQFGHLDRRGLLLAVQTPQQLWIAPVSADAEPDARQFMAYVNAASARYRFG